jgi:predicted nucleotide-binding protein
MKSIIWVDDDIRYQLRPFLDEFRDKGISILTASNASEGKKAFEKAKDEIDAVIVDIMMDPGEEFNDLETKAGFIAGLALARFIKKEKPEMPVIGFSIKEDLEVIEWFAKSNCLFMRKGGISPHELFQAVEKLVTGVSKKNLKSFIIHGHDDKAKLALKNYIQNRLKIGEPIILHEQPNLGRTIIEKFEEETRNVDLVFVLLTHDDAGAIASDPDAVKRRARQNVIFEMGYFYGLLTRKRGKIILLHKGELELPSDISGIVYIDISAGIEAAGEEIRKELREWL